MKIIMLLSLLVGTQSALAGATGEPVLTKYSSRGPVAPKYRNSKTVEVFPMGDVQITTNQASKQTIELKKPLTPETMRLINHCGRQLVRKSAIQRPSCAGGSFTRYFIGKKMIASRACGEFSAIQAECVNSLLKILDRI